MKDKIFIDTNIWLYAFIEQDYTKFSQAKRLINENIENVCLSVQVLNEICINLLKKSNYTEKDVRKLIKNFEKSFSIFPLKVEDCLKASKLREKYLISYWDSLIIASAVNNNCEILYSEDMQNNLVIENKLKILNPFEL